MKASESTAKLWSATTSPSASTENLYARGPDQSVPGTHPAHWVHVGRDSTGDGAPRQTVTGSHTQHPPTVPPEMSGGGRTYPANEHITLNLAGSSADLRSMKGASGVGGGSGRPRATSRSSEQQQEQQTPATEASYGVSVAASGAAYGLTSVNSNHGAGLPGSASSRSRHSGYSAVGGYSSNGSVASFNVNGGGGSGDRSACMPVICWCYIGKMRIFVILLALTCFSIFCLAQYMDSSPITRQRICRRALPDTAEYQIGAVFVLLTFTGGICRAQSKHYKCSLINEAGFCFIENVHLDVSTNVISPPSGSAETRVEFPHHPTLLIKSGAIPYFGKDVFALLGSTRQLHVYNSTSIKNLFIPLTNLTEINVQRNGLSEFDVEPVDNRELKVLTIVHNGLVSVPRNIRFLVGLEKLYLYNNSLEHFDLELFANASTTLKILSIYDNRIKTIDSRAALQFPKLQTLSLSKNKLAFVPYFEEAFPGVTVVSLRKNPWSCSWLQATMQYIDARKVLVVRKDASCRDRWISEICCTYTLLDFMYDRQAAKLAREEEIVRNVSIDNLRLVELVHRLESDVHKLQLQLDQQQQQLANSRSTPGPRSSDNE
uniref:Leucine rich immune protein (Short) n=1 Tax=Anopheles farauti TaxID=69004 RepID=A0A182QFY9_9DIPT